MQHEDSLGAADAGLESRALLPETGQLLLDPRRQLVQGGVERRGLRYPSVTHKGLLVGRAPGCSTTAGALFSAYPCIISNKRGVVKKIPIGKPDSPCLNL